MAEPLIKYKWNDATNTYKVRAYNDAEMGEFYQEIDGYYVFDPILKSGYWPSEMLRAIADELDNLNKEWNEEVHRDVGI